MFQFFSVPLHLPVNRVKQAKHSLLLPLPSSLQSLNIVKRVELAILQQAYLRLKRLSKAEIIVKQSDLDL